MKLIPHNKNVGLVFFGVLIVAAIFLFVSDKTGGSPQDRLQEPTEGSLVQAEPYDKVAIAGVKEASFSPVDWQPASSEIPEIGAAPNSFTPEIAKVEKVAGPADLRLYANDLTYALRRYADPKLRNEVHIMLVVDESGDPSALGTIDTLKQLHLETIQDLSTVRVPEDLAVYHAGLMSALAAITLADDTMKKILSDPDQALTASRAYMADINKFYADLQKISNALLRKGVIMNEGEKLKIYLGVSQ